MKVRKIFLTISFVSVLSAAGCGVSGTDQTEDYSVWMEGSQGYLSENGYYFTRDSDDGNGILLYYFDFASGNTLPVCDNAECDHRAVDLSSGESVTCNAQICTYDEYVVYKDKIYYIDHEERKLCLRRRDIDGNNDGEVAVLDASQIGGRMWFYRDYAFVMASTDVSQSFDPETKESEESVMRLFVINLNSGKADILTESSLTAAINYAFNVYSMENGEVSYYDLEKDEWYIYNTDNGSLEVQEDIKSKARVGDCGEYTDIYGKYCYDIFEDDSGFTNIMRLDRETGEETVIYSREDGMEIGYAIYGMNCMYISEMDPETYEIKVLCFYDMDTGELNQVRSDFYKEAGATLPIMGSEQGIVYPYAVNIKEGQAVYHGDMEYRFMSLEDMLEGNDRYQVIYYWEQEEE